MENIEVWRELLATCKAIEAHCRAMGNIRTLGDRAAHTEDGMQLRERLQKSIAACEKIS